MSIITLGQYLRPSAAHLPVGRYYHPDEFAELAEAGRALGFAHVESGPLVRSSYHAKKQADAAAGRRAEHIMLPPDAHDVRVRGGGGRGAARHPAADRAAAV